MKIAAPLALFSSLALAAPGQLGKRVPDHTPVTVQEFDSSFDVNCGKHTIKGENIERAVSWGVNLQDAGETLGSRKYPHRYNNNDNFEFHPEVCKDKTNRQEFPVITSGDGYFNGDDDTVFKFRAIYVHKQGDQDLEGHGSATYCGTIYHAGDGFAGCDVTKKN